MYVFYNIFIYIFRFSVVFRLDGSLWEVGVPSTDAQYTVGHYSAASGESDRAPSDH